METAEKEKIYKACEKEKINKEKVDVLFDFYIKQAKWSQEKAIKHLLFLIENGLLSKIKIIGPDGKEV